MDPAFFRQVLGNFATGVTIVTTRDVDGNPAGLTANAFTSVSLDPPLVLVCLDHNTTTYSVLRNRGSYTVHILSEDQADLAMAFAKRDPDKFARVSWTLGTLGDPVLSDYLALLECRVVCEYPGGDHGIFMGKVEHMDLKGEKKDPLLFFRGKLGGLIPRVHSL